MFKSGASQEIVREGISYDSLKWQDSRKLYDGTDNNKKYSLSDSQMPKFSLREPHSTKNLGPSKAIFFGKLDGGDAILVNPYSQLLDSTEEVGQRTERPARDKAGVDQDINLQAKDQLYANIKATIETIGVPQLQPMQVVFVDGVGRFGGNYLVEKITHQLDSSGFKTTLALLRPGTDAKSGSPASPVNLKEPGSRGLGTITIEAQDTSS